MMPISVAVKISMNMSLRHIQNNSKIQEAKTREEAIAKMRRALDEFILEGIKTTVPFHQKLMKDERFETGNFHTGFLREFDYTSK